jgi:hypothetical protein
VFATALAVVSVAGCGGDADRSAPTPSASGSGSGSVQRLPSGLVALVADERHGNRTLVVIDPASGRRIWSLAMPDLGNDSSDMEPATPMTPADRVKIWYTARWSWGKALSQDWSLLASAREGVVRVHARQSAGWAPSATWQVPDVPKRGHVVAYFDAGSGRLVVNMFEVVNDTERWFSVDPRNPGEALRTEPGPLSDPKKFDSATAAGGVAVEWSTTPDARFAGGGIGAAGRNGDRPYECWSRTGAPTVWCAADLADRKPAHGALVAATVEPGSRTATLRTVLRDVPAGGLLGAFVAPDGSRALLWTGNGWLTMPADGSAPPTPAFTEVEGVTPTTYLFPLTWI